MSERTRVHMNNQYKRMNKYDKTPTSLLSNPWVYVGVTFAWTWAFWGVAILLGLVLSALFATLIPLRPFQENKYP